MMEKYTMEDGLATNPVHGMFQDSKGFMWFFTRYGLSRYDGVRFTNFTKQNGLASSYVSAMFEDKNNILHIASNYQLQQLKNGRFTPNILKDSLIILGFYKEPNGSQIIASDGDGIVKYSKEKITPITQPYFGPNISLIKTKKGNLLVGGSYFENGIYITSLKLFNAKGVKLTQTPSETLGIVHKLYADGKGNIWVCTVNGLGLLSEEDVDKGYLNFKPLPFENPLLNSDVTDMLQDHHGNYWIATLEGLIRITSSGQITVFTEDDGMASNKITCLFKDHQNNLWAGTVKGITKISMGGHLQYFTTDNGLGSNELQSVFTNNENKIYLTTVSGHIQKFNPETLETKTLTKQKQGGFLKLLKTRSNKLFVGYNPDYRWTAKDLYHFDPQTGLGEKILHHDRSFFYVETDDYGNYFLAGNYGLYVYNSKTKNKYIIANLTERINQIVYDPEGYLWASTWAGKLFRLTLNYSEAEVTATKTNMSHLLNGAYAGLLFVDSKGNIWAGSRDKGVTKISKSANGKYSALHITPKEGLMSASCYVSAEDEEGGIFISSLLGMDKLIPEGDTYKVLNFSKENGFYNEIWDVELTQDGTFWVATASGLAQFTDPHTETLPPPKVFITNILNKTESETLTIQPSDKNVILPHNRGNLQLDFAAPYFINENAVRYSYRLLGATDESWSSPSNNPTVSFAGLQPNKYRFEVKTLTWNGSSGKPIVFEFKINPPWWQTWWFQLLFVLTMAATVLYFMNRRIKTIRYKVEIAQKIVETELKALRAQMNPHFIFNCINNIDAFVQNNDRHNATVYLNKFAKLLRNVLDSSRKKKVPLTKDLETLKLYVDLEQLRDQDKYKVVFNIDKDLINADYQVPPLIVQPFVENAIIHGLRNKQGLDGILSISVSKQMPYIKYVIEDNGVGIKAAKNVSRKETSYGTQMSRDRVKFFNNEEKASVVITNLKKNNKSTGTKVEVLLKME